MAAEPAALALRAPVACIVGPTASGKTDLAQAVALALGGEVVSADSMQVYRGMDIGTGKIPFAERLVPHHGLDLVDPGQPFSAALFQRYARDRFREIDARGLRSVLAGGTGFYVRAAIDGYEFPAGEQVDNPVRERCTRIAEQKGAEALWQMLSERDPASAAIIPAADVKRVARAFELLDEGCSYAEQRARLSTIPQVVPALFVGLAVDPDVLRARIDARVDAMVEAGSSTRWPDCSSEGSARVSRLPRPSGTRRSRRPSTARRRFPKRSGVSRWPHIATRSASAHGFARTPASAGSTRTTTIRARCSTGRSMRLQRSS